MEEALLEMEEGPAIAYFLGKNPEVNKKLLEMSPTRAVAEVGKMAAEFSKEEKPEASERKVGPDKLPVSSAPAPIKPLTGHSTRSTVSLDNLDYAEYRKVRDKQEKERYRR